MVFFFGLLCSLAFSALTASTDLGERVQALFVPAFQNAVAVRPAEFVAVQDRPVVSLSHGLRRKSHLRPRGEILFLARRARAALHLQRRHVLGISAAQGLLALHVLAGLFDGKELLARPDVALFFDLAHVGQPPLAELLLLFRDAVVDERVDHVRGQTQIFVQP